MWPALIQQPDWGEYVEVNGRFLPLPTMVAFYNQFLTAARPALLNATVNGARFCWSSVTRLLVRPHKQFPPRYDSPINSRSEVLTRPHAGVE